MRKENYENFHNIPVLQNGSNVPGYKEEKTSLIMHIWLYMILQKIIPLFEKNVRDLLQQITDHSHLLR